MDRARASSESNPRLLPVEDRLPLRGLDLERLVNLVRLAVVASLVFVISVERLRGEAPLPEIADTGTLVGLLLGLLVLQVFLAYFPWDQRYSRILGLLDVVVVTFVLWWLALSGRPLWATNSQVVFLGYLLGGVLVALRGDVPLAKQVAVSSFLSYGGLLAMVAVGFDPANLPSDSVYGGFRWDVQVLRLALIAGSGVAVTYAARLAETERQASRLDPLTGVFNRRFLDEYLTMMVARAKRARQPLSVLMVDLDGFKRFNDTYGHQKGDEMLREVALSLAGALREDNVVARYGGDEFVVVLPATPGDIARTVAADLCRLFGGEVSLSVGLACLGPGGGSKGALLQAADEALYRAKKQGGGIVVAG
ncbi:MAG: diguanylate cyclase [Thermoanaerobaculum sp.]